MGKRWERRPGQNVSQSYSFRCGVGYLEGVEYESLKTKPRVCGPSLIPSSVRSVLGFLLRSHDMFLE